MDTITAMVIDHEPVEFRIDHAELGSATIPVVVGFNADGNFQTAADLARRQRIDPVDCNHTGATWSSNLDMRCPHCGSAMFLPPRLLAHLPAFAIWAMNLLWSAAGWPEWRGDAWSIIPDKWDLRSHSLFDYIGGLPVRHDRQWNFAEALQTLAEEGCDE